MKLLIWLSCSFMEALYNFFVLLYVGAFFLGRGGGGRYRGHLDILGNFFPTLCSYFRVYFSSIFPNSLAFKISNNIS